MLRGRSGDSILVPQARSKNIASVDLTTSHLSLISWAASATVPCLGCLCAGFQKIWICYWKKQPWAPYLQGEGFQKSAGMDLKWKLCFEVWPQIISSIHLVLHQFQAHNFRKDASPTNRTIFLGNLKIQIHDFQDVYFFKTNEFDPNLGSYGLVWAHITTGPNHMLQDNLKPLLTP